MNYFELLNLRREPFSNSPDPDLFYHTKQHRECLQALEIAIRLKRGLSVVTGHVGTGKTTLCRQLIRVLDGRQGVITHLVLDPSFTGAREFLVHLAGLFGLEAAEAHGLTDWELREHLKSSLFELAVEEDQLVVLIVDEGQKIGLECLEVLRELLNYETNEHKLLQIVIFGQLEFEPILEAKANLADRVNLRFRIGPLDFQDTRELIQARLAMCSKDISPEGLFSFWAFLAIYLATDGFPRQIVQLCHQALLAVIIKEKPRVTWGVVRSCMRWRTLGLPRRRRGTYVLALGLAAVLLLGCGGAYAVLDPHGAAGMARTAGDLSLKAVAEAAGWWEKIKSAASSGKQETASGGETSAPAAAEKSGGTAPEAAGPVAGPDGSGRDLAALTSGPGAKPATAGETVDTSPASARQPEGAGPSTSAQSAGGVPSAQAGNAPQDAGVKQKTGSAQEPPEQPSGQSAAPQAVAVPEQAGTGAQLATAQGVGQDNGAPRDQAETPSDAKEPDSGPPRFTGVEASEEGGAQVLDILLSRPAARFEVSFKPNPSRVLVDVFGLWGRFADREQRVGAGRIDKVRNAIQTDRLRVAIYLRDASAGPVRPEVEKTSRGLRVVLK